SPRPDCSMTIGTMPRAWVSSALMGKGLRVSVGILYRQKQMGPAVRTASPHPMPSGASGLVLLAHQLVERNRLLGHFRLRQDVVGDVVLDHHRFYFGQALRVAEVPAHHFGRLLVAGGEFLDVGFQLL